MSAHGLSGVHGGDADVRFLIHRFARTDTEEAPLQSKAFRVRAIRVASHFPFWRVNPRLEFDRDAAHGCRLALPSGHSVRWVPGEAKEVELIRVPGLETQ